MENGLPVAQSSAPMTPLAQQAKDFLKASRSERTLRAYRTDWHHFSSWCAPRSMCPLPASAETVVLYLTDLASPTDPDVRPPMKPSTLQRRVAAISVAHQAAGHESPTRSILVRDTLRGIRRTLSTAQDRKTAVRAEHLREIVPRLPDTLHGLRDRALLLLGYAGAFRRSELVGLDVEDLGFTDEGVRVVLRHSKTDQEGEGYVKGIGLGFNRATCPVRALRDWIESAGITEGPLFRSVNRHGQVSKSRLSDKAVGLVLKDIADRLGMDPDEVGGHSLRAGFITDQYAKGTPEAVIMQQTGHRSRNVLGVYRREADAFAFNYTAAAGL